jgi:hypothetical protein
VVSREGEAVRVFAKARATHLRHVASPAVKIRSGRWRQVVIWSLAAVFIVLAARVLNDNKGRVRFAAENGELREPTCDSPAERLIAPGQSSLTTSATRHLANVGVSELDTRKAELLCDHLISRRQWLAVWAILAAGFFAIVALFFPAAGDSK